MKKVARIIQKKPLLWVVASVAYALGVGVLKWGVSWPMPAFLYGAGAMIGVYFLDAAEVFFAITPSPFRSVVFGVAYAVVSFFVATSSGSLFGSGLVLSGYLSLLLWQIGELHATGTLDSWYRMVAVTPTRAQQTGVLFALTAVFLAETYLFVR